MNKGKKSSLPTWNAVNDMDDEFDSIKCDLHPYINTSLFVLLGFFLLIFISTHWDNTMSTKASLYSFPIKHQKAGEWVKYPLNNVQLKIEDIHGFLLCCLHKSAIKMELECDYKSLLEYENKQMFINVYSEKVLENLMCFIK